MRICELDIPSAVLTAQREGKLVVFAGAGVSRDPPSNYPDFAGLVKQIGQGTKVKRKRGEPDDHYLGRLKDEKVSVHELAKKYVSREDSKPNALHTAIVRLFTDGAVRIVTTNFDKHFTEESRRLRAGEVEIWNAPALPLGHEFEGLVYIHGTVEGPVDRLVLTDRDFSRAYLTEGWARRFLLGVYAEFTVLFVGYSHNDTVLSYLVRGMGSNTKRMYALTSADETDQWNFLGIEPITFPLKTDKDRYGNLRDSLIAWADRTEMGMFGHEQKIRDLLSGKPPVVKSDDDDYLIETVLSPERIHIFTKYAVGKPWLLWSEERGLLASLFSNRTEPDDRLFKLAGWFARQGVLIDPEISLGIFYRHKQMLSKTLWAAIALVFHSEASPNVVSLKKWLPILLDLVTPESNVNLLEYLFTKTAAVGSWPLVFLLFDRLTRPRLYSEENYSYSLPDSDCITPTSSEVIILGTEYWLNKAWEHTFKPNLSVVARDVLDISAQNICRAYDLGVCHGIAGPNGDILSYRRSAIEAHDQDNYKYPFYTVIDACRDSLEWLVGQHNPVARAIMQDWLNTSAPLLRRIAIHCLRLDQEISSDQKLYQIIASDLGASIVLHHELFLLLRDSYPTASKLKRKAFLDYARRLTEADVRKAPVKDKDMYWHSLFTLLMWLDTSAKGKCLLVKIRLQRLQKKHPSFRLSEYPEFTHWSSEMKDYIPESPLSADEMLAKPVEEVMSVLLSYRETDMFGRNRDGLLSSLTSAVKKTPGWGVSLAAALPDDGSASLDVVSHLLWGWRDTDLSNDQWRIILETMIQYPVLLSPDRDAAMILKYGVNKEKNRIPELLMPLAEQVAGLIWAVAEKHNDSTVDDSCDWLQAAINVAGGQLTEFFIAALSIRRKQAGAKWTGMPKTFVKQLDRIITSQTYAGEMGRIILASQLHFLLSCDSQWTRKKVVPLLVWRNNKRASIQAWNGFATWGKLSAELLPDLLPLYENCFDRLDSDLTRVRKPFVAQVASICLFSSRKQVRGRWLGKFLQSVAPADRLAFAEAIRSMLWNLEPEQANKAWQNWLNDYWKGRLVGKPIPLDQDEANKMAEWVPFLGPAFPEAVQRVAEISFPPKVHQSIYHLLYTKELHTSYPLATAKLLQILIPSSYEIFADYGDLPEIIRELAKEPSTHVFLKEVFEHMAANGSDEVAELRELLTQTKLS